MSLTEVDTLAQMGAGFTDPTHGAQQTFRVLLDAMSRPGRLCTLPAAALAGLEQTRADMAPPTGIGMAAVLLTLLDADTPVLLVGSMADERTPAWIRFHTSARAVTAIEPAPVAVCLAREATPAMWERLALGSDESPQDGATLLVDVDGLSNRQGAAAANGIALVMRGPGIEASCSLVVSGLPATFWDWRLSLADAFPRGVDLVLIHGTTLAAIPRSTRIERKA